LYGRPYEFHAHASGENKFRSALRVAFGGYSTKPPKIILPGPWWKYFHHGVDPVLVVPARNHQKFSPEKPGALRNRLSPPLPIHSDGGMATGY
jgi:hypothetical protein